jgi:hypothetical protein
MPKWLRDWLDEWLPTILLILVIVSAWVYLLKYVMPMPK